MILRLVIYSALLNCLTSSFSFAQTRDPFNPAPRAYELYSWPSANDGWTFSLRPNTNSEATVEQVFGRDAQIHGTRQIEGKISKLPTGSRIYWIDRIPTGKGPRAKGSETLTFPPPEIRDEIRQFAEKHHIKIELSSGLHL